MSYVELHCHSAYSFLDGVSLPEELAQRAAELGYEALALTDHNSVSGSMELAQAAAAHGLRAIHGAEIDLAPMGAGPPARSPAAHQPRGRAQPGPHVTLLVEDESGWRNLCRIITIAHAHTRDGPGRRELGEPQIAAEDLAAHAEGLVCLTGCAARSVLNPPEAPPKAVGGQAPAGSDPALRTLLEGFGPERLYVELQRPYARHDRARNRAFAAVARRLGLRTVATGDVHSHSAARAELQDAFVALRHRLTLDASEPLRRGNRSHVMAAPRAMASRFADHPEAVAETLALAERLRFDLTKDLGYRYPGAEERDASRRLAELCAARLQERFGPRAPSAARARYGEAERRLAEELRVIDGLGLAGFFLLHHEMLELAREVAVEVRGPDSVRALLAPGRGRGSSVSSLVCYLAGLSHIDPIENDLALGRFLHEDLHGLPDIDLDFPRDIRERLIPRVHDRFGRDRAALVAAFPTFRMRGAVRELGKVLGLPPGEIERIARGADPWGPAAESGEVDFASGRHERDSADSRARPALAALALARPPRRGGAGPAPPPLPALGGHDHRHAAADRLLPGRAGGDGGPPDGAVGQGLLRRRRLSEDRPAGARDALRGRALRGGGASRRGERIDLSRIPFDDPETFRAIRAADTVGVFQVESRAQMQSLLRTRPRNLEDLTIQVAIVRPGPIQGGAVNPYIKRRQRLREDPGFQIPYDHPALEPVLKETLGTIIFQDQVMQVAETFAGFTPGEADGLRRAMSRKRSGELLRRQRERFVEGAMSHSGATQEVAERVWEMVEGFAGFGFPKAHSAAFGLLAYQSTWLRVHYGAEFLCALLNEQPMGFYAPDSLVHEAMNRARKPASRSSGWTSTPPRSSARSRTAPCG